MTTNRFFIGIAIVIALTACSNQHPVPAPDRSVAEEAAAKAQEAANRAAANNKTAPAPTESAKANAAKK